MAKKNDNYVEQNNYYDPNSNRVPLTYRMVSSGITPAPRPVTMSVQLPPVVMPVSFVPYATEDQPLAMYDDEYQQ